MTISLLGSILVATIAGLFAAIVAPLVTAEMSRRNWRTQKRLELKHEVFRGATAALAAWLTDALDAGLQNSKPEHKGIARQVEMRPATSQALEQHRGLVAAFFSPDVSQKYDRACREQVSIDNVPNTEFEERRIAFVEAGALELGLTAPKAKRWWKPRLFSVVCGAGIVAAALLTARTTWSSKPETAARAWNRDAILAKYVDFYLTIEGQRTTFTFRYLLENRTGHDWSIPGGDALYKSLANGKGLQRDSTLRWEGGPRIPVGQPINVGLQIDYDYSEGANPAPAVLKKFIDNRLEGIDGFVALDEVNRYDVRLPKPPRAE